MLDRIAATLFPMRCPGCGARAEPVCASCTATMRAPVPVPAPLGLDAWYAAFAYDGVARELVARVKYRRAHGAVAWLAAAMVDVLPGVHVDVVTWAPTTEAHRRDRGFDHAELLARAVAARLRLPVRALLVRVPSATPQTGLASAARRGGPRRFAARTTAAARGAAVLVVDDVATTGTTLGDAALSMRDAGAASVVAVTAARTPPPGRREALARARIAP
jgi:predicted amidophosphoribosyltransferase